MAIRIGEKAGRTYFITAKHVVLRPAGDAEACCARQADSIALSFPGMPGSKIAVDDVVLDEDLDLAVLVLDSPRGMPAAASMTTGVRSALVPGQPLVTVGPSDRRQWDERRTKLEKVAGDILLLPGTAAERSFSGGPVFDATRGTLVGMIVSGEGTAGPAKAIGIEVIVLALGVLHIPSALSPGPYQVPVVFVPAGQVSLGGRSRAVPAFYMDRDEVSVAQFRQFVREAHYDYQAASGACTFDKPNSEMLPVNCVTWEDAAAFARWAGKALPGEAEWLRAAGPDGPAGRAIGRPRALLDGPPAIGTEPDDLSAYGVRAVSGSLSEWTADWSDDNSWSTADAPPATGRWRILRGSAYIDPPDRRRASATSRDLPSAGVFRADYGFRLMSRPPPE